MSTQYSYEEEYMSPEAEFHAEELRKRLQYSMANFAQIRFKRLMQTRLSLVSDSK